jgi:peptidoglycan hydrolase-like protein with peptidoglycan-binding domain
MRRRQFAAKLTVEGEMRGARALLALTGAAATVAVAAPVGATAAPSGAGSPSTPSATTFASSREPSLRLGSRGGQVKLLQQRLIALGYLPAGTSDSVFGRRTWHAVVAFQGWHRLHRDGIVGARTRSALASAVRPHPWAALRRGLELDLQRQVLLVVQHGETQRAIHISSARPGYRSPTGRYTVYRRERLSWSAPYQAWMPYALYFTGGYAVHGYSPVPEYPASHGCIRLPLVEAPFVYAATPLHTPVVIR